MAEKESAVDTAHEKLKEYLTSIYQNVLKLLRGKEKL